MVDLRRAHLALGAVVALISACGVDPGEESGEGCGAGMCGADESGEAPAGSCGDGMCGADESCGSCGADCGACAPVCDGDGACEPGETCELCPGDCGSCGEGAPCASVSMFLMPMIAVLFGTVFLGERLGFNALAGMGLILCGSFIVNGAATVRRGAPAPSPARRPPCPRSFRPATPQSGSSILAIRKPALAARR